MPLSDPPRYKMLNGEVVQLTQEEVDQITTDQEASDLNMGPVRSQRTSLLLNSDWTQIGDATLGDHTAEEWRTYRQALKDIPQNYTRQSTVVWPEDPPTAKITRKTIAGQEAYNAAIASDPDDTAAAQTAYDTAYAATD